MASKPPSIAFRQLAGPGGCSVCRVILAPEDCPVDTAGVLVREALPKAGDIEPVEVFFDDLDAYGMVYHGRFAALVEHGLSFFTARRMGLTVGHEDANVLVREVKMTFEQPLMRIGTVDMAVWVEAVGSTSTRFGFRFESGDVVHAYGHRVVVKLDPITHRPAPWTERTRKLLMSKLIAPDDEGASAA